MNQDIRDIKILIEVYVKANEVNYNIGIWLNKNIYYAYY